MRFRSRILILQLATVVFTILLLGIGSYFLLVSSLEALRDNHLSHLVSEGSKDIEASLRERELRMEGLDMESFRQRYGDLPLEKHFLEYFKGLSEIFPKISLLDQQGEETVKLIDGKPADDYLNYRYTPIVQLARRQPNRMHVGVMRSDILSEQPMIQLAYTYTNYFGDQFLGTLLVSIPISELERHLNSVAQNDAIALALISEKGELLTYNRPDLILKQLPFNSEPNPVRYQLFGEDLVLMTGDALNGGLQVLATVPWNVYRSEINKMRSMAIVVGLFAMLFGTLIALKLSGFLSRNIIQLVKFAEQVGQGDYRQQLPQGTSEEFNLLNNAFNRMILDLETHRQARDSYLGIIESIIDPLIVTNSLGLIIQMNKATLHLFHCESARLMNRPLEGLFWDIPQVLQRAEFGAGLMKASVENLETYIRSGDGEKVPVLFSSSPISSETDSHGVVCILKDITELVAVRNSREQALIAAEEARRNIDVLLRSVPDGLIVSDLQGRILLLNPAAEKMLGMKPEKRVEEITTELLTRKGGSERVMDILLPETGSSTPRVVETHASEIFDKRDQANGLVMLLRDVSRERRLDQMKNEFISTAAHELRTPLTSILGYSELMLEPTNLNRFTDEERQDFLQEILSRAETLARIIDDLLSISRIESGQPLALEKQPTDISYVIERVIQQFKLTGKTRKYELELLQEKTLLLVDAERIQQVLENLLSNAVKYSEEGSLIRIQTLRLEDSFQVVVEDQGVGIPQEKQARIFDKFYRVDYGDTKISGLGIGLSIVKQIIDGHDGRIKVTSILGQGTRIQFNLPLPGQNITRSDQALKLVSSDSDS